MKKLKIYVSGPITGRAKLNIDAFRDAEKIIQELGHRAVVPHDLFDGVDQSQITWEEYMKHDITEMLTCDMVLTLEGWHESRGASIEVDLARKLNIPVDSVWNWAAKLNDKYNRVNGVHQGTSGQLDLVVESEKKGDGHE